ncbi:exonuclease [Caudoviricetes sp.]|nr:exonuclease [Caudoviricetes sp.]
MTTQLMQITDEQSWLKKRDGYVTSTEVSALYGLNPYVTHYELWHQKRGLLPIVREENNFMLFGKLMEYVVCQMILHEHPDWKISPMKVFAYDDEDKIGSSFDRVVTVPDKGTGLLEIKTTSYKYWKEKFIEHDGYIEATPQYEVQFQTELEVLNKYDWILSVVFIADTRTLKYIWRDRDRDMGRVLRQAVKEFWVSTEPPAPDFERDKSAIARLMPQAEKGKAMDATENERVIFLATAIRSEKDLENQSKENAEKFTAELLTLVQDYQYVWTNTHKITVVDSKTGTKSLRITEKGAKSE